MRLARRITDPRLRHPIHLRRDRVGVVRQVSAGLLAFNFDRLAVGNGRGVLSKSPLALIAPIGILPVGHGSLWGTKPPNTAVGATRLPRQYQGDDSRKQGHMQHQLVNVPKVHGLLRVVGHCAPRRTIALKYANEQEARCIQTLYRNIVLDLPPCPALLEIVLVGVETAATDATPPSSATSTSSMPPGPPRPPCRCHRLG